MNFCKREARRWQAVIPLIVNVNFIAIQKSGYRDAVLVKRYSTVQISTCIWWQELKLIERISKTTIQRKFIKIGRVVTEKEKIGFMVHRNKNYFFREMNLFYTL